MHIALVIPDLKGGGAQKMMINLANELARQGVQLDLVLLNGGGIYQNIIEENVKICNFEKPRTAQAIFALSDYIKEQQPDIMMSALFHVNLAALLARKLSGVEKTKLIVTERNHLSRRLSEMNIFERFVLKKSVQFLYRWADRVVGISDGVCADLRSLLKPKKKNFIRTIHNPVVTEDFEQKLSENAEPVFPENCGVKLVASGRLVLQKDYPTMLKAFAFYRQNYGPAHLVILGDGGLKGEIETLSLRLNVADHIDFIGFVANPLAVMKQADIFVVSSAWEGFCNVIVEALYCGLKVVSTDCPSGPSEVLDDGVYGSLIPVGDAEKFGYAIHEMAKKEVDPGKQKNRAMHFTVDKKCNEFKELFREVLKNDS